MTIAAPVETSALLLELFPEGTTLDERGELLLGGCRAGELAARFGTPLLAIDEPALRRRARLYVSALAERWPRSRVVWASKSLPHTAIYRILAEEGLAVDVAGGGELVMSLAAGVAPSALVLHGNAKTDEELAMALAAGVGTIVIDGLDDVDRLEAQVTAEQSVLLRIIPEVAPRTHAAVATGQRGSKFGVPLSEAPAIINRLRASPQLRLDGLHLHIGSQLLDTGTLEQAVAAIASLGRFDVYDLGGGLGARYTYAEDPPGIEAYLDVLIAAARRHLPAEAAVWVEPGRSVVAQAGVTLYRVTTVKRGDGTIVAVDGGMADNLEVSLYGQRFEATVVDRVGGGQVCALVGRHCESGDQLIDQVPLREPLVGDVLAVPVTGAYCLTLANNYNGALRPPIVLVGDGSARLALRRETYDDLLRRDA